MAEAVMTDSSTDPKPAILVNRTGITVSKKLRNYIDEATAGLSGEVCLDIASAYFNVGGYKELCDSLDKVGKVRLLLGAEPDDALKPRVLAGKARESISPKRAEETKIEHAIKNLEGRLATDRDLLGFTIEADKETKRLVKWLSSDKKVEVRLLRNRFLHGKAYIINTLSHGVIAGSSNFTRAGLTSNAELNLGLYDQSTVSKAQEWFEEHWSNAEPYDLAALYQEQYNPHSPQLLYLRMLWEWQGGELQDDESKAAGLALTGAQQDGVWRAQRILNNYNGVLIADEVGLGKTFIAGELIRVATQERRQRALVIAPATLRDGTWSAFVAKKNLNVELLSFEELTADPRLNPTGNHKDKPKLKAEPNEYALVVIDEAHNARNPNAQRAEAIHRLLAGTPRKQLVMLTATPVNNTLWDLHNLLSYFLYNDAVFADIGIRSLREHFAWATRQDPTDLSPKHLFDVIDPVTVRRTRKFVKDHYSGDTIETESGTLQIKFPTPRVTRIEYNFDSALPGFFKRFADALDPDRDSKGKKGGRKTPALTMARYRPSAYLLAGREETYEARVVGLLRSMLLKRFESSPHAFANTCEKMAKTHDAFLKGLKQGVVATSEMLTEWIATDSDDIGHDDIDQDDIFFEHEDADASAYDVKALATDVMSDRDLLMSFAAEARTVKSDGDPTLKAIVGELVEIAKQANAKGLSEQDQRNRRKVLIFSYFADTVSWVYDYLAEQVETDERLADYRDRVASISGTHGASSSGRVSKEGVLWGFAPETMGVMKDTEDRFDIVVTTDVLAEGVNLQQAQHIINYDLPWNPMRLVQRHGRIDRIGSKHSEVFIRCVFPDDKLDDLLGLEERIRHKLHQAAVAVGVASDVIPGAQGAERVFTETREEIERLRLGDPQLLEQSGIGYGGNSGEEFRRELAKAIADPSLRDQIKALPWGSGSGMAAAHLAGTTLTEFVFCAKVGDYKNAQFRTITVNADGEVIRDDPSLEAEAGNSSGSAVSPPPMQDTLVSLTKARPPRALPSDDGFGVERVLDDKTQQLAYIAWAAAVEEIKSYWNKSADKKNLSSRLPKAQRDAISVLQKLKSKDYPEGETDDSVKSSISKLEVPLKNNLVSVFRKTLDAHTGSPSKQAMAVLKVIDDLGLEPHQQPEPLPTINAENIYLVCWMALTPPKPSRSKPSKPKASAKGAAKRKPSAR